MHAQKSQPLPCEKRRTKSRQVFLESSFVMCVGSVDGAGINPRPYRTPKGQARMSVHKRLKRVRLQLGKRNRSRCQKIVASCAQPFTATLTGFESLKVNCDLAESVELSFFCLSAFLSADLLAASLLVLAWILSDGRSELVSRS